MESEQREKEIKVENLKSDIKKRWADLGTRNFAADETAGLLELAEIDDVVIELGNYIGEEDAENYYAEVKNDNPQ